MLSRVLWGGREILALALLATAIGIVVGTALGTTAGYVKGALDEAIMRALDVALAFPQIILALLLVSIIGPELWLVCLAVAAIHAPQVARVARAATLRTVEQDHVKYAEAFGIPRRRVILGEVVPNIISPVMVEVGLRLTYSIAIIASLSFLGFGLQPPSADWGLMVNENRIGIQQNPWPVVAPIVMIAILTVGVEHVQRCRRPLGAGDRGTDRAAVHERLRRRARRRRARGGGGAGVVTPEPVLSRRTAGDRGGADGRAGGRRRLADGGARRGVGPGRRIRLRQDDPVAGAARLHPPRPGAPRPAASASATARCWR